MVSVPSDFRGKFSLSMNQLVEKFSNFSLTRSYCEYVGNFVISISSKYGVDVRTATLYGILGCLCLWVYVSKRRPRPRPGPGPTPTPTPRPRHKPRNLDQARSCFLAKTHGGDLVLQRMEEFNKAQVNPATLANTENLLKALLEEEHLDIMKLQQTVAKLEMSRSEDSAVKILEEAAKKAHAAKKPHEAYEIEMLLVEMLIYKGELEKALECNCLKDESIKDKRHPLYKAIIYKMQGDTKKAKEFWENFGEVRDPHLNGAPQIDFKEFVKIVDRLQIAIQECAERINNLHYNEAERGSSYH